MYSEKTTKTEVVSLIFIVLLNITVGAWSVIKILSWFGKDLPLIVDILAGLIFGSVTIPIAIFAKLFGLF